MKLQDAIARLEAVKPGDTDGLSNTVRYCEARMALTDTIRDADRAEWDHHVTAQSRRVYGVVGA